MFLVFNIRLSKFFPQACLSGLNLAGLVFIKLKSNFSFLIKILGIIVLFNGETLRIFLLFLIRLTVIWIFKNFWFWNQWVVDHSIFDIFMALFFGHKNFLNQFGLPFLLFEFSHNLSQGTTSVVSFLLAFLTLIFWSRWVDAWRLEWRFVWTHENLFCEIKLLVSWNWLLILVESYTVVVVWCLGELRMNILRYSWSLLS